MTVQIPRGTQDILPGEVEKWNYIENTAKKYVKTISTGKSGHRFSNIPSFSKKGSGTRRILSKKKCTHSMTGVGAA